MKRRDQVGAAVVVTGLLLTFIVAFGAIRG